MNNCKEFNEDDFFVMNIEDFLTENDMDRNKLDKAMKVHYFVFYKVSKQSFSSIH